MGTNNNGCFAVAAHDGMAKNANGSRHYEIVTCVDFNEALRLFDSSSGRVAILVLAGSTWDSEVLAAAKHKGGYDGPGSDNSMQLVYDVTPQPWRRQA